MEKVICTMFFTLISISNFAQTQSNLDINNLNPFVGNWEWINGNEAFNVPADIQLTKTKHKKLKLNKS